MVNANIDWLKTRINTTIIKRRFTISRKLEIQAKLITSAWGLGRAYHWTPVYGNSEEQYNRAKQELTVESGGDRIIQRPSQHWDQLYCYYINCIAHILHSGVTPVVHNCYHPIIWHLSLKFVTQSLDALNRCSTRALNFTITLASELQEQTCARITYFGFRYQSNH